MKFIPELILTLLLCGVSFVGLHSAPLMACGPDYEVESLSDRVRLLDTLHEGLFLDEVHTLVEPSVYRSANGDYDRDNDEWVDEGTKTYQKGAALFHAHKIDAARKEFAALLELPKDQRQSRELWALYMLGRIDGYETNKDAAIAHYRQLRKVAEENKSDDLGLALASLGQEAALLRSQGKIKAAITLYAQQATRGSSGAASLLFVVRDLIRQKKEKVFFKFPLGERLLALYLHTRGSEVNAEEKERLHQLITARAAHSTWARYFYRRGDWKSAARFAKGHDDSNALWVRAKLATKDGKRAEALALMKRLEGLLAPTTCNTEREIPSVAFRQLTLERAVLLAAEKRYAESASTFRSSPSQAYLLERVLDLDELTEFVNRPLQSDLPRCETSKERERVRELYARRLYREGRLEDAIPYFGEQFQAQARKHLALVRKSEASPGIDKASALFELATATRHDAGLTMAGHFPDYNGNSFASYTSLYTPEGMGEFFSEDEAARIQRNAPRIQKRYQYRFRAAEILEEAALFVPSRSQAFAALYCHAISWVKNRDAGERDRLYKKYLAKGALVDFGMDGNCPAPDFEGARVFKMPEAKRAPMRKRYQAAIALGVLLSLGMAVWFFQRHQDSR